MSRDEIARVECTRDPIFLFETSEVSIIDDRIEYSPEKEMYYDTIADCYYDEDQVVYDGFARRIWSAKYVWYTREEAENYYSPRYHTEREGKDWRVFCTCAEGELRDVLKNGERISDRHTKAEAQMARLCYEAAIEAIDRCFGEDGNHDPEKLREYLDGQAQHFRDLLGI